MTTPGRPGAAALRKTYDACRRFRSGGALEHMVYPWNP
jgi:hypothetical protein